MIIPFLTICVIIIYCLLQIWDDNYTDKMAEKTRIERIKDYVTEAFSDIEEDSDRFGYDYAKSLMDYADKMDKMSSSKVKSDLKPYDVYHVKRLSENLASLALGRIVIDKDLTPRFMATALNDNDKDVQLSVALTSDEVRELAEKCKKIAMDKDIDNFRKDKVNNIING